MITMPYRPHKKTRKMLDWGLTRVKSVDYRVTARWLFYRYVEEVLKPSGLTTKQAKSRYDNFLQILSRARKRFYNGWRPNTLVDDTRKAIQRGFGYFSQEQWLEHFKKESCILDKHVNQEYIVEIWFEAAAMFSQFAFYTKKYYVTLRPFKGDASIDYKWSIAKHLEEILAVYEKPIVILYFGDYDEKGLQIPESALRDIRNWCNTSFIYKRCGINQNQIIKWNLLESFDKEGTYQWEALPEDKAKELIINNVEEYLDYEKIQEIEKRESRITSKWKKWITDKKDNNFA